MTEPVRIICKRLRDVPCAWELLRLANPEHHVVLEFPRSWRRNLDKMPIMSSLSKLLPEHSVFDSGGDRRAEWITIRCVISQAAILGQLDQIKHAVAAYIDACDRLIAQREVDCLPAEWTEDEHGSDVCFRNKATGQTVEAPLCGAPAPKEIDPYFFAVFVKTTGDFRAVADLIHHDFHDARRMLDELIAQERAQQSGGEAETAPSAASDGAHS